MNKTRILLHKIKFIKCTNMKMQPETLKNRRVHLHSILVGYYVSRSYVFHSIHIFYTNQTPFNSSKIEVYRKINFFISSHHKQTFCNTYRNSYSLIATPRKQRVYYPKNSTIENYPYKPHQSSNHNPSILDGFLSRRILLIWFFGL